MLSYNLNSIGLYHGHNMGIIIRVYSHERLTLTHHDVSVSMHLLSTTLDYYYDRRRVIYRAYTLKLYPLIMYVFKFKFLMFFRILKDYIFNYLDFLEIFISIFRFILKSSIVPCVFDRILIGCWLLQSWYRLLIVIFTEKFSV